MILLKNLLLESTTTTFSLTKVDAQEVMHKIGIVQHEPDLQEAYGITQEQIDFLVSSIPQQGGVWSVPNNFLPAIKGEMEDHINVLKDIARDAYNANERGQSLRIGKQAIRLGRMFGV